jgi:hypothetical protein
MRIQRLLGVARLALLALAHPVDFAQRAEYTRPVLLEAVAVQYARGARARRYGVRRGERVGGGRHRAVTGRQSVGSLLSLEWRHSPTRVCLAQGV